MKLLIKEISTSRKEVRLTINPVENNGTYQYIIGDSDGTFDEGTMQSKYLPVDSVKYNSVGPNPGIIRLVVAYLKDTLGTPIGFANSILVTSNNENIPIVNIAIDDVTLVNLSNDTIPSVVIKLLNPLPDTESIRSEVTIEKQLITTQEQEVYYISAEKPPEVIRGLDYDADMRDEIGNSDAQNLAYQNYNQLTSSFNHSDQSIINDIISGSNLNLKVDYSNFENHTHFGSAVTKLENFKRKVVDIENSLVIISKSLATSSLQTADDTRKNLFEKIQNIKNEFTPYEKSLYYKSDTLGYDNNLNLGPNYIKADPLKNATKLQNNSGFDMVYHCSGSDSGSGHIDLFKDKYFVEDKPFYNYSGSFYLSYLMRGDEALNGGGTSQIIWKNNQENYYPRLPYNSLHSSSILNPSVKSGSWERYIHVASMSYWAPHSSNPNVGVPGSISNFSQGSSEITLFSGSGIRGNYPITVGSRYTNLATSVTSSGVSFTGSIVPAGELFRIYAEMDNNAVGEITSSYLTDIKITKYNPINNLPFSEIYSTGSAEFVNWYNEQHTSASNFDKENPHSLVKTLPAYLGDDNNMDNSTFRIFVNMMGEQFDITKNYIDGYPNLFKTQYGEVGNVSENLLPMLAKNYNWHFMLPFGKKQDADLQYFLGSTISNINNSSMIKNNIWRNIINNIQYIYKSKGTLRSIRALLNSYGFPPDILKIREHGSSMEQFNDSILSNDTTNLINGIEGTTGSFSFTNKQDNLVSYIIDTPVRQIGMEWWRDEAEPNAVEFVFNPKKSSSDQKMLVSTGSAEDTSLWELKLESSASTDTTSRLSFILNNTSGSEGNIQTNGNFVSMSTSWLPLKNGSNWNVLLQRTTGPNSSFWGEDLNTSHSYELMVGEQKADKIKTLEIISMSYGGVHYSHSAAAWVSTGSRGKSTGQNLIVGRDYTGGIAEVRTWKQALSASVFKQHIFDKKSVVGNNYTSSRNELIYHFRLNEDWRYDSSSLSQDSIVQKFKDYNPNNIKDYSITWNSAQTGSLASSSIYEVSDVDRIQFNVKIGGAYEANENNIIIDPPRRFVDNLNPYNPSMFDIYHPLINKRKASSELALTRNPQEVINDFILNQLGNYDFNDLFADPQDINKDSYRDLEVFAKDFFDHYNISMDVNKYIKAQAAIFNKDLIKSIKRLIPARAKFEKVGVELKPTFFERQKIQNTKIEKEYVNFQGDIPFTDWDKDKYSTYTIENLDKMNNDRSTNMTIASETGSITYDFTKLEPLYDYKDIHVSVYSPTGSTDIDMDNKWEFYEPKEGEVVISSHTGSYPDVEGIYSVPDEGVVTISSETGSIVFNFSSLEPLHTTHDITFKVADSSGSIAWDFKNGQNYINYDSEIILSSTTGSIAKNFAINEPYYDYYDMTFVIASHTGSWGRNFTRNEPIFETHNGEIILSTSTGSIVGNFVVNEPYYTNREMLFSVATTTGSISKNFTTYEPLYSTKNAFLELASATGSSQGYYDFTDNYVVWETKDSTINISSATGSITWDFEKLEPLHTTKDTEITIATSTGSVSYDFEKLEPLYSYKEDEIQIATATSSIAKNFTTNEPLYKTKDTNLPIASNTGSVLNLTEQVVSTHDSTIVIASETGSKADFSKLEPLHTTKDAEFNIATSTGSIASDFEKLEPLYKNHDSDLDIGVSHDNGPNTTSSISFNNSLSEYKNSNIVISTATSSYPVISNEVIETKDGTFNFSGNTTFYEHLNKSYSDIADKWGTGSSDVWFINSAYSGSIGLYNTYHYESRYIFQHFGDVEAVSGSYPDREDGTVEPSFETNFDGTFGPGDNVQDTPGWGGNLKYTSSKHFRNQTFVKTNEFLGYRPLGTTIEIKYSGSLDNTGYRYFDERMVYPANHIFIVGTSKDSIDRLIYKGTQNQGGDFIESEAFTDLSEDSFYRILTPGGNVPTVNT